EVPYVHISRLEIRPDLIPIVHSRCDDNSEASISIRHDDVFIARLRIVVPRNRNHVLGQNVQQFRILHGNVTPKHQLLVVGLHDLENLLQMLEVHASKPFLVSKRLRPALSEFESLIRTDMKERTREYRHNLPIELPYKLVGFRIRWREHVPV